MFCLANRTYLGHLLNISAIIGTDFGNFRIVGIDIDLIEESIKYIKDIVLLVFKYINIIKKKPKIYL